MVAVTTLVLLPVVVLAELRTALLALEVLLTELLEVLAELRIALLALEPEELPELALERTELELEPELTLERTAFDLEPDELELLAGLLLLTEPELLPEDEELRLTCWAPERVGEPVLELEAELRTAPELRVAPEVRVALEFRVTLWVVPDPELALERVAEALERTADDLLLLVLCCCEVEEELRDPLLVRV